VVIVIVAIGLAAVWFAWDRMKAPARREEAAEVGRVRELTLYFGSQDAGSLVPEYRQILSSGEVLENLRRVIEELIAGPGGEGVATLPSSVRVRGAFIHDKTAFIDFSTEIKDEFSGGTAAEYMLVSSVVQTVCANFTDVEAVRILIDGKQVDTIGGHLLIAKPLRPREWR
jgi:spore germination protein GerM